MSPDAAVPLRPPRGMRDFYPEDMVVRNAVFDAWRQAAERFGFVQYDSCVVESLELLVRKAGEEIAEQIYAFRDKSERDLALRAEMTPTLARMIAARQGALSVPLKWFAIAQCFRYERMTQGRKREHYQWNLDVVGEPAVTAEAEVLACAADALSLLGLGPADIRFHLSSRALLGELLVRLGIAPSHHAATFLALDKRGKLEEGEIAAQLGQAGLAAAEVEAVLRLMRLASLDEVLAVLGEPTPAYRALEELFGILAVYGIPDWFQFDISVIRGLGYYTGIVFEAFDARGPSRAILGGGRYDNLLQEIGGRPMTAVGMGFGDVVVSEILAERGLRRPGPPPKDIAVGYLEDAQRTAALRLAGALRSGGRAVDLSLRAQKAKSFFTRAGGGDYREAVFLGPDDVARGMARCKNLADRTEKEIPIPG